MLGKRTLFSWRDSPPQKPDAPFGSKLWEEQNSDYVATRWTDSLCKIIVGIPVVRGMLDGNPDLGKIPISFVEKGPEGFLAYYDKFAKESVLNAESMVAYSSEGDLEYSDLQLNCIFYILHELRHAHQYSYRCDPWLKTLLTENPLLVTVYDSLVREADATTFALTGIYEIIANPSILKPKEGSFEGVMSRLPETASRKAFASSIRNDVMSFYTGEAQQRAFAAYFSEENEPLSSLYVDLAILANKDILDYSLGGRISSAFQSAASREVFNSTYSFLKGMPSLENGEQSTLIERSLYLDPWPINVGDLINAVSPAQFEEMGFRLG